MSISIPPDLPSSQVNEEMVWELFTQAGPVGACATSCRPSASAHVHLQRQIKDKVSAVNGFLCLGPDRYTTLQ